MIEIVNDGQDILQTNYWNTEHAKEGLVYLSWNAGAARVLIPNIAESLLEDMSDAEHVIISRGILEDFGVEAFEIMWEDNSDSPFCIHIVRDQCDRIVKDDNQKFIVAVWTEQGKFAEWPGFYRVVETLPCAQAW